MTPAPQSSYVGASRSVANPSPQPPLAISMASIRSIREGEQPFLRVFRKDCNVSPYCNRGRFRGGSQCSSN